MDPTGRSDQKKALVIYLNKIKPLWIVGLTGGPFLILIKSVTIVATKPPDSPSFLALAP